MNQKNVGKFIAEMRKKKGLTQEELAERLGVNSRSVSRWETGRCMPDLSLLSPLSKELDISINDLISGEEIKDEEYQDKFEENVMDVVSKVEKKNNIYNIITNLLIGIIVIFSLFFMACIFYVKVPFIVKYDKEKMEVLRFDKYPSGGTLTFYTSYSGTINRLATSYKKGDEEIGLIFVHMHRTLQDIHNDSSIISDYKDVDLQQKPYTHSISVDEDSFPAHYKVYYTTVSFKEIAKATNDKLQFFIDKSYLMFEKN